MKSVFLLTLYICLLPIGFRNAEAQTLEWNRVFAFGGQFDNPWGLVVDRGTDSFFVGGYSGIFQPQITVKAAAAKLSPAGLQQWAVVDTMDRSVNFGLTALDHGIVWCTKDLDGVRPSWLVRTNALGGEVWRVNLGPTVNWVSVFADTIVLLSGQTGSAIRIFDRNGTLRRSFPVINTYGAPTVSTSPEHAWISGLFPHPGVANYSGFIAKYDHRSGALLWRFDVIDAIRVFSAVDEDGNAYLAGSITAPDSSGRLTYFISKLDPSGGEVWRRQWLEHPGPQQNYENWVNGVAVSREPAGTRQVVIFGETQRGTTHTTERYAFATGTVAATGDSLWTIKADLNGTTTLSSFRGGDFASENRLILAGVAYNASVTASTMYVRKYQLPTVGVRELPGTPETFRLHQNYPNPFNPRTTIRFELTGASLVRLTVWNLLGQKVATLVDEKLPPGNYETPFDASTLPSGAYLYRLEAGSCSETRKMLLVK